MSCFLCWREDQTQHSCLCIVESDEFDRVPVCILERVAYSILVFDDDLFDFVFWHDEFDATICDICFFFTCDESDGLMDLVRVCMEDSIELERDDVVMFPHELDVLYFDGFSDLASDVKSDSVYIAGEIRDLVDRDAVCFPSCVGAKSAEGYDLFWIEGFVRSDCQIHMHAVGDFGSHGDFQVPVLGGWRLQLERGDPGVVCVEDLEFHDSVFERWF